MSKKDIFQAVLSIEPFLVSEFIDFERASRIESLFIIKKMFSRTHTTYSNNKYEIYHYSFLDKDQNVIPIENGGWRIEEVYDGHFGSLTTMSGKNEFIRWSVWNDYLISDPNGELRRKKFANPKEAFENLGVFSNYPSWSDFELENQIGDVLNE